MTDVDYDLLSSECERMLAHWRTTQPDGYLDYGHESGFEYGFELGWRIAKGEVID